MLEPRIPLVFTTYAPNLWKVFLMYAQDLHGKMPSLNLPFPEVAKCSERYQLLPPAHHIHTHHIPPLSKVIYTDRALFGLPFGVTVKKSDLEAAINFNLTNEGGIKNYSSETAFIMTKLACIKFARDYGLVPFLMTKKQLKDLFNKVNRKKNLSSTKTASGNLAPTAYTQIKSAVSKAEFAYTPDKKIIHSKVIL